MYEIEFYRTASGKSPVEEFIKKMDPKMRAKTIGNIALLQEYGDRLGMPFTRSIGDGIFELRTGTHGDITRILFFFAIGKHIVLTNGFTKKTRKTPHSEIEKAKDRKEDWSMHHGRSR